MYNFVDQLHQHRRKLLLVFAVLALFAVLCHGQDSLSISLSSGEELLQCVYRGVPYFHGESWEVDHCTTCSCDNGTLTCVTESCQPALCPEPIKPVGECCYLCPYNVLVKRVTPEITSQGSLFEGGDNNVILRVPIKFKDAMDTTGVSGEGLWRLSAWASANEDGTGERTGYQRQTLSEDQMAQYYKKKEAFVFDDVRLSLNDPLAECDDLIYICTRLDRGDMPRTSGDLDFQFGASPDEAAQTGCTPAPECKGIVAREFEWSLEPRETVMPGRATSVGLYSTVFFREGNPELTGSGLWRMGIFGSRNMQGTGDRFGYTSQTLNGAQSGTTLREGSPLEINNVETDFELGSVGCNDYGYVCVEFTGGNKPRPSYFFRVEGAADASPAANTITRCREQECLASATAIDMEWDADIGGAPFDQPSRLSIDANVNFERNGVEVEGQNLWQMGLFAATSPSGTGPRRDETTQILYPFHTALPLENGGPLQFDSVRARFPVNQLGCDEYGYLCLEFKKGERPSPDFKFATTSGEESIITCKEQECRGITASPSHVLFSVFKSFLCLLLRLIHS